jgi:hypothetical protein
VRTLATAVYNMSYVVCSMYIHMCVWCILMECRRTCVSVHEGKDEAMASRGVIFQSVAGRESGVTVLVVSFAIFISTRPDFRDFLTSIISVQNYNRFLVYLTKYRSIEI